MGEIHEALKRAAEAKQSKSAGSSARSAVPPLTSRAPSVSEVASAARGEIAPEHSSAAPELVTDGPSLNERLLIPRERTGDWAPRAVLIAEPGGSAEAYRHFAIRLRRELEQRGKSSALVASALRGEGKTTTSCNLALALASMSGGQRVALVDLDLRRPSVGRVFGARPAIGIDDVLRRGAKLAEACLPTDLPTLDLYPVATQMPDPHVHLAGDALPDLLAELHARYQTVIVDSPPMLLVPDGALILPHVGGVVPVLRARVTKRRAFEQMLGRLPPGAQLGCFLNAAAAPLHAKQYGYYQEESHDDTGTPTSESAS